jgi:hypothetical protein
MATERERDEPVAEANRFLRPDRGAYLVVGGWGGAGNFFGLDYAKGVIL